MTERKATIALIACAAGIVLAACGGKTLSSSFPENRAADIGAVLDALKAAPPAGGAGGKALAAVVRTGGAGVALYDLGSGARRWERADVKPASAPFVGGGVVALREGTHVLALSADDGRTLWSRDCKEPFLYGFAADGGRLFVTAGNTDGGPPATGRRGRIEALDALTGKRLWTLEAAKMLGAPAAAAGFVFVPWDRHALSVLGALDGREVCRVIRKDGMVDFVTARGGGLYYGSAWDAVKLARPGGEGAPFAVDAKEMPGEPRLWPDTYLSSGFDAGAKARNRILWEPAAGAGGDVLLAGGMFYLLYFKYLVAFDAADRAPRWVYMSGTQIVDSAAAGGGVVAVGKDGTVTWVDGATGSGTALWSLEGGGAGVAFAADAFAPPKADAAAPDLHRGLVDLILDTDTQVLPLRKFGMKLLVEAGGETLTGDLVHILASPELPKALRDEAAKMLRAKKGDPASLMKSLEQHVDFLDGVPAPPAGSIATSLVEAGEKKAAPLLLGHLLDHETPAEELQEIATAVVKLGDETAWPALRAFLLMYHADSSMRYHVDVLVTVAKGILAFGGEEGRAVVRQVADDPKSHESLRFQLAALLEPKAVEEEGGAKEGAAAPGAGGEGE